jgi:predicted transposase YbfD/YdcC
LPKKTIATAVASGNDVLVQVKGNQPALVQHLQALAKGQEAGMRYHQDEIGKRNRIESRTTSVWHVPKTWLSQLGWPHICCVIAVQRGTEIFDTRSADWTHRGECAWYVGTRELTARQAHDVVRGHWQIENGLHHIRDVSFGEDASQIRTQPGVFAQLRTLALNCLRQLGHDNIKAARQIMSWSEETMLKFIEKIQR